MIRVNMANECIQMLFINLCNVKIKTKTKKKTTTQNHLEFARNWWLYAEILVGLVWIMYNKYVWCCCCASICQFDDIFLFLRFLLVDAEMSYFFVLNHLHHSSLRDCKTPNRIESMNSNRAEYSILFFFIADTGLLWYGSIMRRATATAVAVATTYDCTCACTLCTWIHKM